MHRRHFLKLSGLVAPSVLFANKFAPLSNFSTNNVLHASDFGRFTWGVATAAAQFEGAWDEDGKGPSVWDTFSQKRKNIKDGSNIKTTSDFYHNYPGDIVLLKSMNFGAFRFSLSWPRIFPNGTGEINIKGIDFYNRVIDACLENGIEPWVCLYHWDLPQALEDNGGWLNRDITGWFTEYTELCAQKFGDRVKNWLVMNEPLSFSLFGYGTGLHAPGRMGLGHFFAAAHHAALCQAAGGRVLRGTVKGAKIGTSFSCSPVDAKNPDSKHDRRAAARIDAVMNRMFPEATLGMGYPYSEAPILHRIDKYCLSGDEQNLAFDFDFWGLQHYFRVVVNGNPLIPVTKSTSVAPQKLGNPVTDMNWEVYPEGIYRVLKQFDRYNKELVIAENGAAFKDELVNGEVNDIQRTEYFNNYLKYVLKAKHEGVNVSGYFAWTLLDNFEWAEGFRPRFGLVYVDYATQKRVVKASGRWFAEFLK